MSHATLAQDHRTITPLAARRAAVTAFVAVDERFSRVRTARVILMVAVAGIAGGFLASLDPLALLRLARRAELRLGGAAYFDYPGIEYQRHLYDCGPAALVMLLRLSSMAAPPVEQVSRDARTSPRGTRLEDLQSTASTLGMSLHSVAGVQDALRRAGDAPMLVWIGKNHFVVVRPQRAQRRILVFDPASGAFSIDRAWLDREWSGAALVPDAIPIAQSGRRDSGPSISPDN